MVSDALDTRTQSDATQAMSRRERSIRRGALYAFLTAGALLVLLPFIS